MTGRLWRRAQRRQAGRAQRLLVAFASLCGLPVPVNAAGEAVSEFTLPRPAEGGTAPTLVVFVQGAGTGDVLQALALPCPAIRASGVN